MCTFGPEKVRKVNKTGVKIGIETGKEEKTRNT